MKDNNFWLHTEEEYQAVLQALNAISAAKRKRERKSLVRRLDSVDRRLNGDRRKGNC